MCLLSLLGSRPCVLEASLGGSRLQQSSEQNKSFAAQTTFREMHISILYFLAPRKAHYLVTTSLKGHLVIFLVLKHR